MKSDPCLITCTKVNKNGFKLLIADISLNHIEENIGRTLHDSNLEASSIQCHWQRDGGKIRQMRLHAIKELLPCKRNNGDQNKKTHRMGKKIRNSSDNDRHPRDGKHL